MNTTEALKTAIEWIDTIHWLANVTIDQMNKTGTSYGIRHPMKHILLPPIDCLRQCLEENEIQV